MELWQLRQRQSLPLEAKINHALQKIKEWYEYWGGQVYVSFSGGKDSTVLLHLVRSLYPDVPAVFADTGLEYPEIRKFVKTFKNVDIIKPDKTFKEVLDEEGYPVISKKTARMLHDLQNPKDNNQNSRKLYLTGVKRDGTTSKHFKLAAKWQKLINAPFKISNKCCEIMKKQPFHQYEKLTKRKPFTGFMADDGKQRESVYLQTGCNSFKRDARSNPLGIWTEQDVLKYIKQNGIEICKVYGNVIYAEAFGNEGYYQENMFNCGKLTTTGEKRTGCIYCMFGVHMEKGENRFQRMKKTHPKLYETCIDRLGCGQVLDYIGVKY